MLRASIMHRNLLMQCSNAWEDKGVGESGGDGADGVGEGGGSHPESPELSRALPSAGARVTFRGSDDSKINFGVCCPAATLHKNDV